jgi:hypothetical protein
MIRDAECGGRMRPRVAPPTRPSGRPIRQSANPRIRQSANPLAARSSRDSITLQKPSSRASASSSSLIQPHREIPEIRVSSVPGLEDHIRDLAHHPTELLPPRVPVQLDGHVNHRVLSIPKPRLTEGNEPHAACFVADAACCMVRAACCMLGGSRYAQAAGFVKT